jgi:hypothetical protein
MNTEIWSAAATTPLCIFSSVFMAFFLLSGSIQKAASLPPHCYVNVKGDP